MCKQLTSFENGRIIEMWKSMSNREIAIALGKNSRTIDRFVIRYVDTGSIERATGSGRKRKTSEREDRMLLKASKKRRTASAAELGAEVGVDVSDKTIIRHLGEQGVYSRIAAKKTLISPINQQKRITWCKKYRSLTSDDWEKLRVLFTDEAPYTFHCQSSRRVWRTKAERYSPAAMQATVKKHQKIMVSGSFSHNGVGDLHRVNGIVDQQQYRQIAIHHLVPSGVRLHGRGFTFQQDIDPKHTAGTVKKYFDQKVEDGTLKLLNSPPQSPDLNPIENLWHMLNLKTKERRCNTKEELFDVLQVAWQQLPTSLLLKLVRSMPSRIEQVLKNDGFPTKY